MVDRHLDYFQVLATTNNAAMSIIELVLVVLWSNGTMLQSIDWEKIFTNPTSDRELTSKIYKELKKVDIEISSDPVKRWDTDLHREF